MLEANIVLLERVKFYKDRIILLYTEKELRVMFLDERETENGSLSLREIGMKRSDLFRLGGTGCSISAVCNAKTGGVEVFTRQDKSVHRLVISVTRRVSA